MLAAIILILHNVPLEAQTGLNIPPGGIAFQSAHYEIIAEPGAAALLTALTQELELRFELYNRVFRFNAETLVSPLKVRVFTDRNAYELYLNLRQGAAGTDAIYLHYDNHIWRELVVLRDGNETAMLASQSFFQFLKAFIPNPPLWIVEGFGIYFNSIKYDSETGILQYEENLAWLDAAKRLGENIVSPDKILLANAGDQSAAEGRLSADLRISSWALVSFLMNSNENFRTLTESFMVLSPHNTSEENSSAVMERFSVWTDFNVMHGELLEYIALRKTFAEHIEEGRQNLETGNIHMAYFDFFAASGQRSFHYAPYYYVGLSSYYENNYVQAEEYFLLSLYYGGDEALVSYALGLNAARAGRRDDAISWLERAAAIDPLRYKARTDELTEILLSIP